MRHHRKGAFGSPGTWRLSVVVCSSRGLPELYAGSSWHQYRVGNKWWDSSSSGEHGSYCGSPAEHQLAVSIDRKKRKARVLGCIWKYSLQGAIYRLVSAQLESCVWFGALLFKETLATLEVERRAVKVTRDPEDMPQGKSLKGLRLLCLKKSSLGGAGKNQEVFQSQVAQNRLLWRGGQ